MAEAAVKAPILETAALAVRFLREQWRPALIIALIAAAASVGTAMTALAAPALALPLIVIDWAILAGAYAALLNLALSGSLAQDRLAADGGRVLAAMSAIGFFLFIVCVVAALPSMVILSVAFAPFAARIEAMGASPDPNALAALISEVLRVNPWPFLIVALLYLLVWMMLTSRLYLSAPASVARRAICTFDTWPWTKGSMWRIIAARLVLLIPAAIIVVAVQRFAGAALGVNTFDLAALSAYAQANRFGYAALQFVSETAQYFVLFTLEAGLSARFYQKLRGESAAAVFER